MVAKPPRAYQGSAVEIMEQLRQQTFDPTEYPDTESYIYQLRSNFILALGFAHDGAALGDGLGGDSEAQVHIGGYFSGVEGSVETPPFHGAAVKDRMQIQGMVARPVIMLGVFHGPFVPYPFQLGEVGGLVRGQRPGLPVRTAESIRWRWSRPS